MDQDKCKNIKIKIKEIKTFEPNENKRTTCQNL